MARDQQVAGAVWRHGLSTHARNKYPTVMRIPTSFSKQRINNNNCDCETRREAEFETHPVIERCQVENFVFLPLVPSRENRQTRNTKSQDLKHRSVLSEYERIRGKQHKKQKRV